MSIAEQAPAIRLACAAASGSAVSGIGRWRLVAAAAVLLAILAGAWTVMRSLSGARTGHGSQEQSRQSEAAPVKSSRPPAAMAPGGTAAVTPPATECRERRTRPRSLQCIGPGAKAGGIARSDHGTDTRQSRRQPITRCRIARRDRPILRRGPWRRASRQCGPAAGFAGGPAPSSAVRRRRCRAHCRSSTRFLSLRIAGWRSSMAKSFGKATLSDLE